MGLDVYLYKYENKEETDRKEKLYEEYSESLWEGKKYDETPESEKDAIREKSKFYASSLGLAEWGSDKTEKTCIEIDSTIDKDHYFKIGYFRSSYNDGGINRVLSNLGIDDLYAIFTPNDEYCFQPDWEDSLKKVNRAIKQLQKKGDYRCFDVSHNIFGGDKNPSSEKDALDLVVSELSRKDGLGGSYSNKNGNFFLDEPIQVIALIPGTTKVLREQPCTYVVTRQNGANEWYLTALKIVRETIEYVLAQPDKQKYWLHWSS